MPPSDPLIRLVLADACHRIYAMTDGAPLTFEGFAARLRAKGPTAARLLGDPSLEDSEANRPDNWKRLSALILRTARVGLSQVSVNPQRCKRFFPPEAHTGNQRVEVCEWKQGEWRVFFFREEPVAREPCTTLIVTHAFEKKQDNTPRGELARFAKQRTRYYDWRQSLGATDAVSALSLLSSRS